MDKGGRSLADLEAEVKGAIHALKKEGDWHTALLIYLVRTRFLQRDRDRSEAAATFREMQHQIQLLKQGGCRMRKQACATMVKSEGQAAGDAQEAAGDLIEVPVCSLGGRVEVPRMPRQSRASGLCDAIAASRGKPVCQLLLFTPDWQRLHPLDPIEQLKLVNLLVLSPWTEVAGSWLNHDKVPKDIATILTDLIHTLAKRKFGPREHGKQWGDQQEFYYLVVLITEMIKTAYKRH